MDLATPIRSALIGASSVTGELTAYKGSFPIFTRRPVPEDAPFPMVVVSSGFQAGEQDGINDQRPVLVRDVLVYGRNDIAEKYRQVETIAFAVRELFHRQRDSIAVSGWSVVDVLASGPSPAPTDDEQTAGRLVELTVRLARM